MNEKSLNCTIKPTVTLNPCSKQGSATSLTGLTGSAFQSGCKIFDVFFTSIINPEASHGSESIGAIQFQNDYVAFLTIKAKIKSTDQTAKPGASEQEWRTLVNSLKLMPDCHAETGSQDIFCITRKQFACDISNVVSLRLILQQPSPMWKDFNIHKLKVFQSVPGVKHITLPNWMTEGGINKPSKKEIESEHTLMNLATKAETHKVGVPDIDVLSTTLQQLWALAEEAATNQPEETIGRYGVDGCYDINLLSYS